MIFLISKYLEPDYLEKYNKDQKINVQIIVTKYDLNDTKIQIMGKIKFYEDYSPKKNIYDLTNNININLNTNKITFDTNPSEPLDIYGFNKNIISSKAKIDHFENLGLWKIIKYITNPSEMLSPYKSKNKTGDNIIEWKLDKNNNATSIISYGFQVPAINTVSRSF